jgi:hypothetical protein
MLFVGLKVGVSLAQGLGRDFRALGSQKPYRGDREEKPQRTQRPENSNFEWMISDRRFEGESILQSEIKNLKLRL